MERGKKKKPKNKVKDLKKVAGSYLNQKGGTEASLSSQKSNFTYFPDMALINI